MAEVDGRRSGLFLPGVSAGLADLHSFSISILYHGELTPTLLGDVVSPSDPELVSLSAP